MSHAAWGLQFPAMPNSRTLSTFFPIIVLAAFSFPASASEPSKAEEQAVLAPIQAMFDGMSKRDADAIKKPVLAGGTMVLMRDGKPTQMTFESFAEKVGRPGKGQIEERIHDPLIRIDNDLAVVWAPFEFLANGKVDHCGTDLFNLVKQDGKWVIASVTDTGNKNCDPR
jgi:Putative lumazine-binding